MGDPVGEKVHELLEKNILFKNVIGKCSMERPGLLLLYEKAMKCIS